MESLFVLEKNLKKYKSLFSKWIKNNISEISLDSSVNNFIKI